MTLTRAAVGLLLMAAWAESAAAETVTWEAFALAEPGREVVGKGVKTYSPKNDIVVQERPPGRDGALWWSKSLLLDDTFAVSASVHRERSLDGFGLVVYRRGDANGFSWDWFDREEGSVFGKRQGDGRVSITVKKGPDYEELESVEFLDDVTLRYLDDMSKPPGTHTHEVIIRKGSVLRIVP